MSKWELFPYKTCFFHVNKIVLMHYPLHNNRRKKSDDYLHNDFIYFSYGDNNYIQKGVLIQLNRSVKNNVLYFVRRYQRQYSLSLNPQILRGNILTIQLIQFQQQCLFSCTFPSHHPSKNQLFCFNIFGGLFPYKTCFHIVEK